MHVELWFSLFFLLISAGSVVVTLVSFLMLVISVFSHFSSVNLTRRLSILLIFSRNQCFRFIDFYLFYCFRFHKFLLLCLSFPFLALGLFYSPDKFLRWELRLWLRDSSSLMFAFRATNFSLSAVSVMLPTSIYSFSIFAWLIFGYPLRPPL